MINQSNNHPTINTIGDLIKSQEKLKDLGAIHIGYTVGWELNSDIFLSYKKYKSIAKSVGIVSYLVEEKKPIAAFREALSATKSSLPKGLKLSEIKAVSSESLLVYALYKQKTKNAETGDLQKVLLETDHKITLTFNKKTSLIEVIAPVNIIDADIQELLEECEAYITDLNTIYRRQLNITKRDISATCAKFCLSCGIPTQSRGGSYFIPKKYDVLVKAFSRLLEEVSSTSVFIAVPCYSSPEGNQAIAKSAKRSLLSEIEDIDFMVFGAIADFQTGEEMQRLFNDAIASTNLKYVFDILKEIQGKLGLFNALVQKIESIMVEINTGMVTLPEVRDRLIRFKESMKLKQMHEKGIKSQIKNMQSLTQKIESFQDFLENEGDNLKAYIGQIGNYLNILISDDISNMINPDKTISQNIENNKNIDSYAKAEPLKDNKDSSQENNAQEDLSDYDEIGF